MEMKVLILSIVLWVIAVIFRLVPPKKINRVYGYRTATSMQDSTTWKLANDVASKYLLLFSAINFGICFLLYLTKIPGALTFAVVSSLVSLFTTLFITERQLKKRR